MIYCCKVENLSLLPLILLHLRHKWPLEETLWEKSVMRVATRDHRDVYAYVCTESSLVGKHPFLFSSELIDPEGRVDVSVEELLDILESKDIVWA